VTELRVFSDREGRLHVELSHRDVAHAVRIAVPMLPEDDPMLQQLNRAFLIPVRFNDSKYMVALASLSMKALWKTGIGEIGNLDENDSRNILNHLVDILGYD
jgi:hypothetical protein